MKILSLSDIEIGFIYSAQITQRFRDVDLVISCGDLPHYYLEYVVSMLNVPVYYVHGNHARPEHGERGPARLAPAGAMNLHRRVVWDRGLLIAGIQGCNRYNLGAYQYTQEEMWEMVLGLVPALLYNRVRYGRYLDIFVSHAPPWGIHDLEDVPHQGIKAFRWLIHTFKPAYHFHGHVHIYNSCEHTQTDFEHTCIINTYGYRETVVDVPHRLHF